MSKFQIAIITGAGRGIGRVVAIGLAQEGYVPILISRSTDQLKSVANEIMNLTNNKIKPEIYPLNIGDHDKIPEIVSEIKEKYKRIHILVNNAGKWIRGSLDVSKKDFYKVLDINLIAPYLFINEIVPIMKEQKAGNIFNIASRAGKIGYTDTGIYSASKFGLVGLSESLYKKLAPYGIRVTTICPGLVDTQMASEVATKFSSEEMIQPIDIMETIRWLLKLSVSTYVKNVVIECKRQILKI